MRVGSKYGIERCQSFAASSGNNPKEREEERGRDAMEVLEVVEEVEAEEIEESWECDRDE